MHSMPCIIPLHTYGKYHSSILKLAIFGPLSIHPIYKFTSMLTFALEFLPTVIGFVLTKVSSSEKLIFFKALQLPGKFRFKLFQSDNQSYEKEK